MGTDARRGVATGVRHARVASLRQDGLVVLGHAAAMDLARDDALQIAEGEAGAAFAKRAANLIDDLLGALADRGDGLDLPRLFALRASWMRSSPPRCTRQPRS